MRLNPLLVVVLLFLRCATTEAQSFKTVSFANLSGEEQIKGLFTIQLDDESNRYLKINTDSILTAASFDATDESFYFWILENRINRTFQLHSAGFDNAVLSISAENSVRLTKDFSDQTSDLLFRMDPAGPLRENPTTEVAIGSIVTIPLSNYSGEADCACHGILIDGTHRLIMHHASFESFDYLAIPFARTNVNSANDQIDMQTDMTTISTQEANTDAKFVSSLFFANGFGINDFKIIPTSGTEAMIGFVDYSHHVFPTETYHHATPKVGLEIKNDNIILKYLAGTQALPLTADLVREIPTGFALDKAVFFGFEDQYTFAAIQGEDTIRLATNLPAEQFINQSSTQTSRLLLDLRKGQLGLAYTPKNGLFNANSDFGIAIPENYISTDPYFPFNKGRALINTFNWQDTKWMIRYRESGDIEVEDFSPFYLHEDRYYSISAKYNNQNEYIGGEDFSNIEGWELLKANLGYNADGTATNIAPSYPFVIMYDRYSANMRVFVYAKNDDAANELTVSLGVKQGEAGYRPLLWGGFQQFKALDATSYQQYNKTVNYYSTPDRQWYFYDFMMEYDPCSQFFESSIELKVFKTTRGEMSIVGRLEGGSLPAGTDPFNNWNANNGDFLTSVMGSDFATTQGQLGEITLNTKEEFGLMKFQTEINGTLEGELIPEWQKQQAKLEFEAQRSVADGEESERETQGWTNIATGTLGVIGGAGVVGGAVKEYKTGDKTGPLGRGLGGGAAILGGIVNIVKGISQVTDNSELPSRKLANAKKLYYESIKDKVRKDDQKITLPVPEPRPHVIFGELALQGVYETSVDAFSAEISTPGALNSYRAPEWGLSGTLGSAPLYNKPLGKFALLNSPQFAIGIARYGNSFRAHLKIKEKPYFVHNDEVSGKIIDALKISVNVTTTVGDKTTNRISEGYTNFFGQEQLGQLPAELDISDLINWETILAIEGITTESEMETLLQNSISVSYEVFALSITNSKSRDLSRVMASSSMYYDGSTEVAFKESTDFLSDFGLTSMSQGVADKFTDYNLSDNDLLGSQYNISNRQDNFAAVMYEYCSRGDLYEPDTIQFVEKRDTVVVTPDNPINSIQGQEDLDHSINIFPNPGKEAMYIDINPNSTGTISLALHNCFANKVLVEKYHVTKQHRVREQINISNIPPGVYVLTLVMPNGSRINRKIIVK